MAIVSELLDELILRHSASQEAAALIAPLEAPRFSAFALFAPKETKVSELITHLLDPNGSHAQGSQFLRLLLDRLEVSWPDEAITSASVQAERYVHSSPATLIDILVEGSSEHGSFQLAIENKLWGAKDQDRQIVRYFEAIEASEAHQISNMSEDATRIVYLTVDRTEPKPLSFPEQDRTPERERRFARMGARELADWLEECRRHTRAPNVAAYITDFKSYVYADLLGVKENEMTEIAEAIIETPERVEAFQLAVACRDEVEKRLETRFRADLEQALRKHGLMLQQPNKSSIQTNVGIVRMSGSSDTIVRLSGSNANLGMSWMVFGIHDPEKKLHARAGSVHSALAQVFGVGVLEQPYNGGKKGGGWGQDDWVWAHALDQRANVLQLPGDWTDPGIWRMKASGELAASVALGASKILKVVEKVAE